MAKDQQLMSADAKPMADTLADCDGSGPRDNPGASDRDGDLELDAIRYYRPISRGQDGEFTPIYVDAYGAGIETSVWEFMKDAGWFVYDGQDGIVDPCQRWVITEKGRKALA